MASEAATSAAPAPAKPAAAASSSSTTSTAVARAPLSSEAFAAVFLRSKHCSFVLSLDKQTDTFEYYVGEHLRMSGVYWGLMAMDLLRDLSAMQAKEISDWVMQCFDAESGGFSGNVGHDPHLLYTLSALQILCILGGLDRVDHRKVGDYICGLQQKDGSFIGDRWGEVDTRFSYCALNAMALLGQMDRLDVPRAVQFVARCRNFDGGFGAVPGAESHAGQIFCCVAALALAGALHEVDSGLVGWWLAERQLPTGGLNGRPEKKQDVCYSWWVLSALAILGKAHWIDAHALGKFVIECQDPSGGGISDRPGNIADVFHTYFGIAGLALLGYPDLEPIDPVYALPARVCEQMKLPNRFVPHSDNTTAPTTK